MKLTELEKMLTPQEVFYQRLVNGEIKVFELINAYVQLLETKNREKQILAHNLTIPLAQYFMSSKIKPKSQEIFMRCKSAYNMIKSGSYKGTPFEKELKALVKKYHYTEDENGMHTMDDIKEDKK